ncbi:PREDICTED: interferon-induced protein with tetratricopeptide repeats 1 [Chrysochloris asiatica]|uniref:Interferon-induced protein with tetratricopeptide repeats 1 n=1 Tax=Chrysochloris asiatica TaxID=185453 RepID=A0A9B0SUM2_CHRAS|nr:PREDICTED: interferon-induced protein with tetratricopeptide repeats 1 [Chrysochloris asiatica]
MARPTVLHLTKKIFGFHSENTDQRWIKERLEKLRCQFTWTLLIEDNEIHDLESRIFEEIEFLDIKYNVGMHNLLAYVRYLEGQNEESLESLKRAEKLIQQKHADQSDLRSLVTWGNYAWVYYHMGKLAEAQTYLNKVKNTCKKFSDTSGYTIECPEIDCEEGWALLKCGGQNYERAKVCFEKALEVDPKNPESCAGYAITLYRLEGMSLLETGLSLQPLKQALRLNPENAYIKALFALKLQELGQEAEGEKYIKEALASTSFQNYVLRYAGKFYRKQGSLDKALEFLQMALRAMPDSALLHHQIGLCYRQKVFQMKDGTNRKPRGQDRDYDKKIKSAIYHLEFAVKQKPTFDIAYIHLASMYIEAGDYRKTEETFQKALEINPQDELKKQKLHFHYAKFQELQMKNEVCAITYYLKAIKIGKGPALKDKSISALEKLALRKSQRNASNEESLSLHEFVCKLRGETKKEPENYEKVIRLVTDFENSEK